MGLVYIGERPDLVEGPYTAHQFAGVDQTFVVRVPFGRIVQDGLSGASIASRQVTEWGLRSLERLPDLVDGTKFYTLPDAPLPKRRALACPYCQADVSWPVPVGIPYGVLLTCAGRDGHRVRVEFSASGVQALMV